MICFRDRGYCSASRDTCFNEKCYRFLSEDDSKRAQEVGLPIAFSDFWVGREEMVEKKHDT